MAKRIIILLDGTSNEIKTNRSNVLRLYGCLKKSDEQVVYYDPGVGTFGNDGWWSRVASKTSEVWGMATGFGIDKNVKEAYRFIVNTYDKSPDGERDEIFIFGFSRGAYTARVLAGFLHGFGIMEQRNLNLLDYAYRAYKSVGERSDAGAFEELRLHERIIAPDRPPVRFLGLFDTVASVIEPGRGLLPRLTKHAFSARNASVQSVRHAVAIDERRTMFVPELWPEDQPYKRNRFDPGPGVPQDAREVWFQGVHGDIGGGYPEAQSQLAKIPLAWMITEAKACGAQFVTASVNKLVLGTRPDSGHVAPDPLAKINTSMTWAWRILEWVPRKRPKGSQRPTILGLSLPLSEPRHIPDHARVHKSVFDRMAALGQMPRNLPKDPEIED